MRLPAETRNQKQWPEQIKPLLDRERLRVGKEVPRSELDVPVLPVNASRAATPSGQSAARPSAATPTTTTSTSQRGEQPQGAGHIEHAETYGAVALVLSSTSNAVMRNPEMTKNTRTPGSQRVNQRLL